MPTKTVPIYDGSAGVVNAIAELEADNCEVTSVIPAGDQQVIVYRKKVGRPPKMETR